MTSENYHQELPTVNKSALARLAGVSMRTVDGWTAAGLVPTQKGDGRGSETLFDPAAVIRHLAGRSDDEAGKSRRRLATARAKLAEIEAARAAGELIPVAPVAAEWQRAGQQVRDRLMGIPARLAAELAATQDIHTVTRTLEDAIREALEALTGPAPGLNREG